MADQNSVVTPQIRPDDLMSELGIGKDTYYDDLKFLGLRAEKDSEGKAYLTEEQANLVRALRSHVANVGKRDGFFDNKLVTSDRPELTESGDDSDSDNEGFDIEELIRQAAELKGQQLAMGDLVKLELAKRMTYDDLPEDVKQKLAAVREAANPKAQPAQVAEKLLSQWRQKLGEGAA